MDHFLSALSQLFTLLPFALCLAGVALGIVVGSIPGLSGSMLIAMTVPVTFFMKDTNALTLLVAMYVGSISGGLVSATLLRMPGTPASVMTTLDGYPMARDGRAGRALGFGISASVIGGIISWVFLFGLSPTLAIWATTFGPWEYFTMVLMALVLIASLGEGSVVKGLLAGFLGILVSLPGVDPSSGMLRLTFGFEAMSGGFQLLPVLLGVFVVSQALKYLVEDSTNVQSVAATTTGIFMRLADLRRQAWNLVRSSLIGTWVGILPGVGSSIGSIVAYTAAKNMSRTPEKFGTGFEDGIVASESANNATVGGALIPIVTMGIPGSPICAILIGAMLLHNLQPGPLLFVSQPHIVYTIITTYLVANVLMFVLMIGSVKWLARLIDVPRHLLVPAIIMFCMLGSYSVENRFFDMWAVIGFGLLGFLMEKCRIPLGPFVIGFVLATLAEAQIRSGLMASAGSYWPLVTRPIALTFLVVAVLLLFLPLMRRRVASTAAREDQVQS